MKAALILPHQLFDEHPALNDASLALIVEDPLFFNDARYPVSFHKQKLIFHRSTMKQYEASLKERGYNVRYYDAGTFDYTSLLQELKIHQLFLVDPVDDIALKRVRRVSDALGIDLEIYESPSFFLNQKEVQKSLPNQAHYAFTPFYIAMRKSLDLLITENGKPVGGSWTYDSQNRLKAPKGLAIPPLESPSDNPFLQEAKVYVEQKFPNSIGKSEPFLFPTSHQEARKWLKRFLNERLVLFGPYEDAIIQNELLIMHSLLSPLLNSGLLTPREVLDETLKFAKFHKVPLNSLEGFLRQVVGWREFVRAVYTQAHIKQRKTNFWNHHRKIPSCFYDATTTILPIDETIKKLHSYAYCHHIERLMVLGSFMLLCEFDPDEIYRWFMEFFIDAYDWVMVPNVYGMSQYADGGLMTTKPYICSSSYIRKMSNYPAGSWCDIWDGLFWRFLAKHQNFFHKQPRLGLLTKQLPKVDPIKLQKAETFLSQLS